MKKQIVLLAAGVSSRFFPFNGAHKSMFRLCGKPIIGWTLDGIRKLKVDEVVVVVSESDGTLIEYLKEYKHLNLKIVYQKEALGMGNALLSTEDFLEENFILGFPHFVNENIFNSFLLKYNEIPSVGLLVEKTDKPWEYGILSFDRGHNPTGIVEKPAKGEEPSNDRVSGCYFLNKRFMDTLRNEPQSEYQFEAALDKFLKKEKVRVFRNGEAVMPLKYPWDLFAIKDYVLGKLPAKKTGKAEISKKSVLTGKVIIEDGARILDFAIVEGPVYIGKNSVVGAHCILREGSILEEDTQIERFVDCTRSIIEMGTHIHSGFVGDSIIGDSVRVGAGFITGNKRIDRDLVEVKVKDKKVFTGSDRIGVLIGDNVKIGINVSTMPGVIIGNDSIIGPSTIVTKNVPGKTRIYVEQEIVQKSLIQ